MRKLLRSRRLAAGALLVLVIVGAGVFSLRWTPYPVNAQDMANRLQPPGGRWLMGTDNMGRDILSRVMRASLTALGIGLGAVGIGASGGAALGALAGYYGGWIDEGLMRLMDGILAFPFLLFALMIVSVLGPGTGNLVIALSVANLPVFARLVRGEFLSLGERDMATAARALGAGDLRIILRHLFPNAAGSLVIQATTSLSAAVLAEAGLSYVGLGTQPPDPAWGRMLRDAQPFMGTAPWLAIFPGLAIAWAVLGFNLLGDGLRDVLDPRLGR